MGASNKELKAVLPPGSDPLRAFQRAALLAPAKPATLIARLKAKFQDAQVRAKHVNSALHYLSQPLNANRVFNGFPELLDEKEQLELVSDYQQLLAGLKKSDIDESNQFKLIDNKATQNTLKAAEAFKKKIIDIAFRELLNAQGTVKQEFAELLADSKEEKAIATTQKLLLNLSVLSGYVGEVMLHVTNVALQTMPENEREKVFTQHLALSPIFSAGYTVTIDTQLSDKGFLPQRQPKYDDNWVLNELRALPQKYPKTTTVTLVIAGAAAIGLFLWKVLTEREVASIELDAKDKEKDQGKGPDKKRK